MKVFGIIIAGFVALVAVFMLLYLGENRRVEGYAAAVARAAQAQPPASETPCAELTREKPPTSIQRCTARQEGGRTVIAVRLQNGRELTLRTRAASP